VNAVAYWHCLRRYIWADHIHGKLESWGIQRGSWKCCRFKENSQRRHGKSVDGLVVSLLDEVEILGQSYV